LTRAVPSNRDFQGALSALQAGRLVDAERLFKSVLRSEPKHVGALNLMGVVLTQLKRFTEAETYFRRAVQEHPASDATLYNYGLVLKALNRPTEALRRFDQALKINRSVAETWNNRGTVCNDLRRYEQAIGDFDKAIAINPQYAEAFYHKGKSLAALERGDEALAAFERALAINSDLAEAWLGCGTLLFERKEYQKALETYDRAVALRTELVEVWLGRGNVLFALKRYADALASYARALTLKPNLSQAWLGSGKVYFERKQYHEAFTAYERALELEPGLGEAWFARGSVLFARRQFNEALANYEKALAINPDLAAAWLGVGNVFLEEKRYDEAFAAYDKAEALHADFAEAWLCRGNGFLARKQFDDALAAYDRARELKPALAEAWTGRGAALRELEEFDEALAAFDRALALNAEIAEAWLGRGNVFFALKRHDEALAACDRAIALNPDFADAWVGRGTVLVELKQYDEAIAACDRAVALQPDLTEAWIGLGNIFLSLKKYREALAAYDRARDLKPDLPAVAWFGRGSASLAMKQHYQAFLAYDKALTIDPDLDFAAGYRLFLKLTLCDWKELEAETARLLLRLREGKKVSVPWGILTVGSTAADQLQCAEGCVKDLPVFPRVWLGETYSHGRVRIAYLSGDFRDHAVTHLAVGLFEHHDRSRFEITGLSFGPSGISAIERRIKDSFEHLLEVEHQSEQETAEVIRKHEIDILIDLMGHTQHARLDILARRAAPIQVHFLGYAGTTGANFIDYIVADSTVVPDDHRAFYKEQVVWLPDSYLPSDNRRVISPRTPTREECGLPENGFVFCSFNNAYKITPRIFELWMKLLRVTPHSVLWLSETDPVAVTNLRREAERWGVAAHRLIFAPKVAEMSDHLARQRQADLFLDTLPYNAHTTASDALWAGLPVLTCLGETFVGRVAASLLRAIGLPELITTSLEDYESLALKLVGEPSLLASIKAKLARNRDTTPLFDTARITRQIEAAYTTMWERYQRGELPTGFAVEPID
jgi:protein O-GlcNAc transferase